MMIDLQPLEVILVIAAGVAGAGANFIKKSGYVIEMDDSTTKVPYKFVHAFLNR